MFEKMQDEHGYPQTKAVGHKAGIEIHVAPSLQAEIQDEVNASLFKTLDMIVRYFSYKASKFRKQC